MSIDPNKLRDVRERFLISRMAELEPRRRESTTANIRWARYNAQLERLRAERSEPQEQQGTE